MAGHSVDQHPAPRCHCQRGAESSGRLSFTRNTPRRATNNRSVTSCGALSTYSLTRPSITSARILRTTACYWSHPEPLGEGPFPERDDENFRGRVRHSRQQDRPHKSARGISPRAAHRSGREPLDSSGSCHPEKAAAFHQDKECLRLPVDSILTWMTCSLCSTGITPFHRSYEAVRPWSVHRYFRPRGVSTCAFSLFITRPGSHVPYESPDKGHAS
jgi:hypothetical protein